ncbi:splicing factor Prp45 [Schizosaccharomyces japonicus yFS275]|uniref:Pre-mRNA-processing protein 45 n=1 Tax=Schizosaccharomyces japonicus (strain yFS275 / FY16936) TaxID=402676 RepID=B6K4X3_SCHJY|nr:splicing factor Prp45 [Schizosaccharomyces japonicus yFS275]EEB08530.2 splicing factor Prp45 [Schizosaccharomyces japonicus yFS275]
MSSLAEELHRILPNPVVDDEEDDEEVDYTPPSALIAKKKQIPAYGQRKGWIPSSLEDFEDGGAFPEIHVAQYPLGMGRKQNSTSSKSLALQVDAEGAIQYDAIVKQGSQYKDLVQASFQDLIPLQARVGMNEIDLSKPSEEEKERIAEKTKLALTKIVSGKLAQSRPKNVAVQKKEEPVYIRYTPSSQMGNTSEPKQRIIKLVDAQQDPLEPPKFRHKKVPRGPPSPPPPVLHSPPRKVTAKEQQEWQIPPSISNWKNPKGYTIPLDKRLAADGRGSNDVEISDGFAKFSEALYVAERQAREEVHYRAIMRQKVAEKERQEKEEQLRLLAQKAREERMGVLDESSRSKRSASRSRSASPYRSRSSSIEPAANEEEDPETRAAVAERERLRRERRKEVERELRLNRMGSEHRSRLAERERHRDVAENMALGVDQPKISQEAMIDTRLFNQASGIGSGFGDDDSYNVYDKPWKAAPSSSLYRPGATLSRTVDADAELERLAGENRFSELGEVHKKFRGTENVSQTRSGPVMFEKDKDPFGVDNFLKSMK